VHHFTDGGLQNVWLVNGYTVRQTPYGSAVSIHDMDGLARAICLALTGKHGVLTGKELRYVRQAGMSVSQPALGKLMGVDGQSVARWEKTGRVPKWADKLLRLVYTAHANGDEPVRTAVDRANTVERLISQRILVTESDGQWSPRVCEEASAESAG
jgi:DNA-binding transcriptional regulator YiaG